jgi:hypothetical protein
MSLAGIERLVRSVIDDRPLTPAGESVDLFRTGIESIGVTPHEPPGLPDAGGLCPSELAPQQRFIALLHPSTLGDALCVALRPSINDPAELRPENFRILLRQAHAELGAAGAGESAHLADAARRVVGEELGLRDLLDYFRSALYQA